MIQRILRLFKRAPKSDPIDSFHFPSGNSRIEFPSGWQMFNDKEGESTFTFFNETLDGILYASELTNKYSEYNYTRQKSLDINAAHEPKMVDISKYGAVFYDRQDEEAEVTYRHFEIGVRRTLLQFTWMTPYPENESYNKQIESILHSTVIE